eukprot:13793813-Alexandrium_andersonii.AAC.1
MGAAHGGCGRHGVCMHWQVFFFDGHDLGLQVPAEANQAVALLAGNLHIPVPNGHPTVPVRSAI